MKNSEILFYKVEALIFNTETLKANKIEKAFKSENPIDARIEALEFFDEFRGYLDINNRLQSDYLGIESLTEAIEPPPDYNILDFDDPSSIEKYLDKLKNNEEFIKLKFVLRQGFEFTNDEEKFEVEAGEGIIHSIGLENPNSQDLMDDLNTEFEIYKHYNFSKSDLEVELTFFGDDFPSSLEDPTPLGYNKILTTPFPFNSITHGIDMAIEDKALDENRNYIESEEYKNDIVFSMSSEDLISSGENKQVEFKPFLLIDKYTWAEGAVAQFHAAKTIASFLNTKGGVLFIGVKDNGVIEGVSEDLMLFDDNAEDKLINKLDGIISQFLGNSFIPYIDSKIEVIEDKRILRIEVKQSDLPCILTKTSTSQKGIKYYNEHLYIRGNAGTFELKMRDAIEYSMNHFNK